MSEIITPSRIWLAAWIAAEKALPPESLALIERHDELYGAWNKSGPIPAELTAAGAAVKADPLAAIAMDLRERTNHVSADEYRAAKQEAAAAESEAAA